MHIAFTFNLQNEAVAAEAEFDTAATVSMIARGLERLGHEVSLVDVGAPLAAVITQLERLAPDLVFNTAEGQRGRGREALFPAIFEHLELPFTGSDSLTCAITLDKHQTKRALDRYGIATPRGLLVRDLADLGDGGRAWNLFPCLIKPNSEGSSKGIDGTSIVGCHADLVDRVKALLDEYPDGVLIEQFIDGVDVVVPYLETVGALEPASYRYRTQRESAVYGFEEKLHGFDDLIVCVPAEIPARARATARQVALRIVKALDIRDLARLDFRLAADGRLVFLEINALPSLEEGASIYLAGAREGLDPPELVLGAIIESAMRRHERSGGRRREKMVAARVDAGIDALPERMPVRHSPARRTVRATRRTSR